MCTFVIVIVLLPITIYQYCSKLPIGDGSQTRDRQLMYDYMKLGISHFAQLTALLKRAALFAYGFLDVAESAGCQH